MLKRGLTTGSPCTVLYTIRNRFNIMQTLLLMEGDTKKSVPYGDKVGHT